MKRALLHAAWLLALPVLGGSALAQSTSTPGGVLITRYVRSGEVRTGSFANQ